MANQYTGSFECIIREKYNCSARDMLLDCQKNTIRLLTSGLPQGKAGILGAASLVWEY